VSNRLPRWANRWLGIREIAGARVVEAIYEGDLEQLAVESRRFDIATRAASRLVLLLSSQPSSPALRLVR